MGLIVRNMSLKTVAILGGSFDPPHVGHQQLARDLKSYFDEVWVVPCGERSDKHTMSSANLRFQMAQAAFKENQVLDIEIRNGSMIPSYFLIRRLSDEHPDYKFSLIIGLDLLSTLHT